MAHFTFFSSDKKDPMDPEMAEKVLELAHQRAEKIIEKALKKSEEIVVEIDHLNDEIRKEMKQVFKQSTDSYIHTVNQESKEFTAAIAEVVPLVKEKYMKGADETIQIFQANLAAELGPLREIVDRQVTETIDQLKKKIEEEWEKARQEINEYKVQQKKQLEENLKTSIEALAKTAFGDALTPSQHQQLVMKALEKAKEEGVFNT